MSLNKAKWFFFYMLILLLFSNQSFAMDSSEEESNNSCILIADTSGEEGLVEDDHWDDFPARRSSKRLKKKNKKKYEYSTDENTSSTMDSDSSSANTSSVIDSDSSSEDEPSSSSIDEDFEPSTKKSKLIDPRNKETLLNDPMRHKCCPVVTTRFSKKTSNSENISFSKQSNFVSSLVIEDESDEENSLNNISYAENSGDFALPVNIGTRLKLLANVYLGNLDAMANIFLPRYTLEVENPDGSLRKIQSFFKTSKNQICVFASGGLHHIWEKNIGHIFKIFYGQKVKIIRAHWMQKHLYKDKGIKRDLEEEFSGRENELHSEFYYDLFFSKFFVPELPQLLKEGDKTLILKHVTIHAFSWWDVCNDCERILSNHKPPEIAEFDLSYKIAARKRYNHAYPDDSLVKDYALPVTIEEKAWATIWTALSRYTGKKFSDDEEKETFWTTTKDGLEVCKWLGQAFRETITGLDGKLNPLKKGDILSFYKAMEPEKTQALEELLSYLQEKNWDLSCWYRGPNFPSRIQPKWKRYWKHQVVPHFGWEEVNDFKHEDLAGHREMCGYDGLNNVYLIFHPKFHASNKYLSLPKEDQELKERELGFTSQSRFSDLPPSLQQKRKQSLSVGSECIKALISSREDIDEWRDRHTEEETEANTNWEVERLKSYDVLDMAEKNLKEVEYTKKRKRKK